MVLQTLCPGQVWGGGSCDLSGGCSSLGVCGGGGPPLCTPMSQPPKRPRPVSPGPTHWKEMAPTCGGPGQSPINIDLRWVQRDPTLGPFIFQGYDSAPPGPWTLENHGHTGAYVNLASAFPLASLLLGASGLSRFYRYAGSLTTRCCEPVELWTVFEDTVPIGRAQVQPAPPPPAAPPSRAPRLDRLRPTPSGGPVPDRGPGQAPRLPPRTSHGELPAAAASLCTQGCSFPQRLGPRGSPHPGPRHGALLGLGLSLWLWQGP
nr:carbonic anhydrase 15-like [Globicephala melas]